MNEMILSSGRRIGDGHPCFIIGEAGSNWRMGEPARDLAMALALIDVAKECGCDAVKFQTYTSPTPARATTSLTPGYASPSRRSSRIWRCPTR